MADPITPKTLSESDLKAISYFAIGVSSEGKDVGYQLSLCGKTLTQPDGSVRLQPVANSGYSIGEIQTDLGAHPEAATQLVEAYQDWAQKHRPDWSMTDTAASKLVADLSRNGDSIRAQGASAKTKDPSSGPDIDQTAKSRLNAYLANDDGKTFVHRRDVAQIEDIVGKVGPMLNKAPFYQQAEPEQQADIFSVTAKAYNQSPHLYKKIADGIESGQIASFDDINARISKFPPYMGSGRNDALQGSAMFTAIRANENAGVKAAWTNVTNNALVNPTQLSDDPNNPDLAAQYGVTKSLFVDTAHAHAFLNKIEQNGSYTNGDPASTKSRGFYAEGDNFVQWDRNGVGVSHVNGKWTALNRDQLSVTRHPDHTVDLNQTIDGKTSVLLHVNHSTLRQAAPAHPHHAAAHAPTTHVTPHAPKAPVAPHAPAAPGASPAPGTPERSHATGSATLREGSQGSAVRSLQERLHQGGFLADRTDGVFGPRTAAAVESFQASRGLKVDGIVGVKTAQAMEHQAGPAAERNSVGQQGVGLKTSTQASSGDDAAYWRVQAAAGAQRSQTQSAGSHQSVNAGHSQRAM